MKKDILKTEKAMPIGFIGAGKVGKALGKYFRLNDLDIVGIYDVDPKVSKNASELIGVNFFAKLQDLVFKSEILFLTVSDKAIEAVWAEIVKFDLNGKIIIHCSGALSSRIFARIDELGAFGYSLHPVMTINDSPDSYQSLVSAHFTLEGSHEKLDVVKELIATFGNSVHVIDEEHKSLYHCAAVFSSNFMLAVAEISMKLLERCGFDDEGQKILFPLMETSIKNVINEGTIMALTGPVERGDASTIEKHLNVLNQNEKQLYSLLSQTLIDVAEVKNPEIDYEILKKVVKNSLKLV